ncbi:MAG: transketolase [Firmicutes bacterium]|nr:transketolase [Bacillota bacterium]
MTDQEKRELQSFALRIRIGTVECVKSRGFGHIGGSLSVVDALAVLYGKVMRIDPRNPQWEERDKLVCSKGHAGPAVYATLALKGYMPYDMLYTLNQPGTHLPSHCDRRLTPGVDMTTGSLGQGTSLAVGMAYGDKLKGRSSRTYLIVGDGELNEGQVWEAAMFAAGKNVNNMTWLIDWNKKQLDGYVSDILEPFDIRAKFEAFGFEAVQIDGHDVAQLYDALTKTSDRPIAIVMDNIKGKGVTQVEQTVSNHSMNVSAEVFDRWLEELRTQLSALEAQGGGI